MDFFGVCGTGEVALSRFVPSESTRGSEPMVVQPIVVRKGRGMEEE
jgi:hypothetical protein